MKKMTFEERKQQRIALQATEEYKDAQRKKSTKAAYLHQIELWERQIEHLQNNIDRMRQWLDRELSWSIRGPAKLFARAAVHKKFIKLFFKKCWQNRKSMI